MNYIVRCITMGDCGICCETYNLKNHTKVECQFCDFSSCRECVQRYILSTTNDPHCMNCKNAWNREYVDQHCTKVFRNKQFKTHRETVLVERERCLLPQTQELVVRKKQELNAIKLLEQCREEQRRQRQLQHELENQIYHLRAGHAVEPEGAPKKNFVRKCPIGDCRGFLSDKWKCELCDSQICKKCNEIDQGEEHECDPNNVETVKMLNKDTKPCPACGTMIFKISGCNQMWCPDCHTAFDWASGRIETGVIHNPHFYEFQRRTGGGQANRNLGDIPCGGTPSLGEVIRFFRLDDANLPNNRYYGYNHRRSIKNESPTETRILNMHLSVIHIQNYEIPQYRTRDPDNSDLRVKYLMNEITEEIWKKELQKREKAREKARDISNLLTMYSNVGGDYFRQMVVNEVCPDELINVIDELSMYFNDTMEVIHKRYNCVTPYIINSDKYQVIHYSFRGDPHD
jgi:hypothetical protein